MRALTGTEPAPSPPQDFEFTNLELVKPTRMNKVYIAFAAQVLAGPDASVCGLRQPELVSWSWRKPAHTT